MIRNEFAELMSCCYLNTWARCVQMLFWFCWAYNLLRFPRFVHFAIVTCLNTRMQKIATPRNYCRNFDFYLSRNLSSKNMLIILCISFHIMCDWYKLVLIVFYSTCFDEIKTELDFNSLSFIILISYSPFHLSSDNRFHS